jgi:hypothetical protein
MVIAHRKPKKTQNESKRPPTFLGTHPFFQIHTEKPYTPKTWEKGIFIFFFLNKCHFVIKLSRTRAMGLSVFLLFAHCRKIKKPTDEKKLSKIYLSTFWRGCFFPLEKTRKQIFFSRFAFCSHTFMVATFACGAPSVHIGSPLHDLI